jgi:hypothetical protein
MQQVQVAAHMREQRPPGAGTATVRHGRPNYHERRTSKMPARPPRQRLGSSRRPSLRDSACRLARALARASARACPRLPFARPRARAFVPLGSPSARFSAGRRQLGCSFLGHALLSRRRHRPRRRPVRRRRRLERLYWRCTGVRDRRPRRMRRAGRVGVGADTSRIGHGRGWQRLGERVGPFQRLLRSGRHGRPRWRLG